jgi:argininosuccinate synthase
VTLGLYKGNVRVLDRRSPFSLYDTSIAAFTMKADYDQKDAEGFINILGLPVKLAAQAAAKQARAQAGRTRRRRTG